MKRPSGAREKNGLGRFDLNGRRWLLGLWVIVCTAIWPLLLLAIALFFSMITGCDPKTDRSTCVVAGVDIDKPISIGLASPYFLTFSIPLAGVILAVWSIAGLVELVRRS